ncbi:hypothetical protein RvY_08181 [Ramazzottius varieornatus]|uniref:DNA topoisomerase I n=1 Tax=Ramazzottius varieornatus TaxID=947166 RepID=A0A1D1V7A8_RAMVA|nr:hypothetical protein RvY_08181 [Ramazzottius varieornatus]
MSIHALPTNQWIDIGPSKAETPLNMSSPPKVKEEIKDEPSMSPLRSTGSSSKASSSKNSRQDGEAAETLLLLSNEDKKKHLQNGTSKVKAEVKSEDERSPSPPPSSSKKATNGSGSKKKKKKRGDDTDDDSDYEDSKPAKKKKAPASNAKATKEKESATKAKNGTAKKDKEKATDKKKPSHSSQKGSSQKSGAGSPRKKKQEEEVEVWKWWEEEGRDSDIKWKTLAHKGPIFAPDYVPLLKSIKFKYDGQSMPLSERAEEVATFYAKMLDHDYTTKDVFNKNFFKDWRKVMTAEERNTITDLKKCDFTQMHTYFKEQSELKKQRTKEEKQKEKEKNEALTKEYGFCMIDNHKEKVGNYRIEPPGLFRGRGEHPKMGCLKRRVLPEDVIINCSSKDVAPRPPAGHKWKEVRHDNKVTWLACWTDNILGSVKYIMLNPSSKLKGEKDWKKYEMARKLKSKIHKIRETYKSDMKSKEMKVRQRAVALYFIDKLALRAGNEKEEGETADTVGCCSLRVEHIKLHDQVDDKKYVVDFDFLGKDSIRYLNSVEVEKRVFKNLKLFLAKKSPEDDVFDRLNTTDLNKHLSELMEGLTAKVFRTYNASFTLQEQLEKLTNPKDTVQGLMLSYNRANRAVAILCNHQRSTPKGFEKQMENAQKKIDEKKDLIKALKAEKKKAKGNKKEEEKINSKIAKAKEALHKVEIAAVDREENKTIALGTSKLNYLDPRISVAWCKKYNVPIEKVYNKTQRSKFNWAIDMAGPEFIF